MDCPVCGHHNREGAAFCGSCGASLAREVRCPHCQTINAVANRFCDACGHALASTIADGTSPARHGEPPTQPTSFANGRYEVKSFLGEGGKKRVYLAHDTKLDRDVAFALLKADGMDEEGSTRIRREAQAMGRLGDHPHIVTVHDVGEDDGQPYIVCQYMAGGTVDGLIGRAGGQGLPFDEAVRIAEQVCDALEYSRSEERRVGKECRL